MLCAPADEKYFDAIEKLIDKEIPRAEVEAPKPEPKPKRERRGKKAEETPAANEAAEPVKKVAEEQPKKERSEKPRGRGRGKRDEDVVGMGDHMPSFIAKSFEERKAS